MSNNIICFFSKAVKNENKSRDAGHPCFDEKTYIRILKPGDAKYRHERPARSDDFAQYPAEYDAFKRGKEAPLDGIPLEEWPGATVTEIANLKALKILTVEHLAGANETAIVKIGFGARALVSKAKAYLESADRNKAAEQVVSLLQQLRDAEDTHRQETLALMAHIKAMQDQISAMQAPVEMIEVEEEELVPVPIPVNAKPQRGGKTS